MIVPLLNIPAGFREERIPESVVQVYRFGLLGRIAFGIESGVDPQVLEKLVVATAGRYEIQILLDSFDEEFGLDLLNAGASKLLVRDSYRGNAIPADRIAVVEQFTEFAEGHGKALDAGLISDHWRAGIDHLVDARLLTSTEIFADVLLPLLKSDRQDGLWPTVIVDELGVALGLAYSSAESFRMAIQEQVGVYFSRSRSEIWVKGKTSGATQKLTGIRVDCDFDTLRFQVEQGVPGFCHNETHTCFGYERNIAEIVQRLCGRIAGADKNSFTKKLFDDPGMLQKKLLEEAQELSEASSQVDAAWEAADVLYFSLVALIRNGASLADVYAELARRTQRVIRRKNKLEE